MSTGRSTINKFKERISTILWNSFFSLIVPLLNFLLYLIVLQLSNPTAWGKLVGLLLVVNLVQHIMSWGSTPYLLRAFSREPAGIGKEWQKVFTSRGLFIFLPILCFLWLYPHPLGAWLSLWLLALFSFRALEVFVVYNRQFKEAIVSEVSGFILLAVGIFFDPYFITPLGFAQLFAVSTMLKGLLLSIFFYRQALANFTWRIDFSYFWIAFPFALVSVAGLLHEKIDLYIVALLGTEEELGKYHVLISALVLLKTGAAFILQPYVKNIYRLPSSSLRKLSRKMILAGGLIVISGVIALWILIPLIFGFDFSSEVYLLGALFTFPYYAYIIPTYRLYKHSKEQTVVLFSGIAILINSVLSVILIPSYGLKGALIATTIAEWTIMLIFWKYSAG